MKKVKNYIVYSTPTCVYCDLLKKWLSENNIDYEKADVVEDPAKGQEMIQKTGQMNVPVSVITFEDDTEEVVLGFNQEKISHLLGL